MEKWGSCEKLIKILRTLGTVFHILWLFRGCRRSSSVFSSTTFKRTFKRKFWISITLRFLIVPLRRGSFRRRHPLPLLHPFWFRYPYSRLQSSAAPIVIETIANALQEFVFKTGRKLLKTFIDFFSDRYFFFFPPSPPCSIKKFYEDTQHACQRFGN